MVKIVIAEDNLMIADMIEESLVEHGYDVCGIARTVGDAIALARDHDPDLILIDLHLADGGLGTEIAAQLMPAKRPGILYATANISQVMLTAADGQACLTKPFGPDDLMRGLELVSEIVAHGSADPPYPRGFHLLHESPLAAPGSFA